MQTTNSDQEAFHRLSCYTLSRQDAYFIHQLIVDTFAVQHADDTSKPIYSAFALAGLYLHNERNFTGKEVQMAHVRLARHKKNIPSFSLPSARGAITVHQVLETREGSERDKAIEQWSAVTWKALNEIHQEVESWLRTEGEI